VISRRLLVNLIAFFAVSFALVGYGVVNLLGNPLSNSTILTTEFPDASGLYPNFTVELNGVPVGTVSSTQLTKDGTKVTMSIDPGTSVPSDVRSSVQIANDLGEQVVNLVPTRGGSAPSLRSGSSVAAAPNQVPADVGAVVESATRLLQAIPAGALNQVIDDLATALQGRGGDLRTIISAGTDFSKEFVAYQQQFTELLANAPPALNTVAAVSPELRQDLANTAALVQVLVDQKSNLPSLFQQSASAFGDVDQLITSQASNLGCVLHDGADILSNLAEPNNLTNLSEGLAYNEYFFGAVNKIAVAGTAKPTTNGQGDVQQVFLRTRLIIPPDIGEPAQSYSTANLVPDVLPGAACQTVYGNGVGPATQAHFVAAAGSSVVPPTAQEARVEIPASTTVPAAAASYRASAGEGEWFLVAVGGLLVPVLLLAWGARPSRRLARRRS